MGNSEKKKNDCLVWVDMEMSGLDPQRERILEIATVITDNQLNIIAKAPVVVIHQTEEILTRMDKWNQSTHSKSGLIGRVRTSTINEQMAEKQLLDFLTPLVAANSSPLCGNSVHQDRRFMVQYMPQLESFFHYRHLDVSTVKELCQRWQPALATQFKKKQAHTALADIIESIDELKFYRSHFFNAPLL